MEVLKQVTGGHRAQAWGSEAGYLELAELGLVLSQPADLGRLPTAPCSCGHPAGLGTEVPGV